MEHGRSRRRLGLVVASAAVLATASCSDDGPEPTSSTTLQTTTTVASPVETDGRLVIGMLLPVSDARLGEPLQDAVDTAIDEINIAGGVFDQAVRPIYADEGQTAAETLIAIRSLIDADVDAIVGPASSLIALATLDEIVGAGKVVCSPTASALALDSFPDQGLFFRTVPSDSLQARGIAQTADQTGAQRAAIVHIDDAYGRGLATAVQSALSGGAITSVDVIPIAPADDDLSDDVRRVVDGEAQVAIVLGDATNGPRILAALNDLDTSGLATVVVNDAMRNPTTPQTIADLRTSLRSKIVGLAPQAEAMGNAAPFDPPGPFAANAFDCVNLIALGAVRAGSDAPRDIAAAFAEVSNSGQSCTSFAQCVETLSGGFQIDYNGPSGMTDISSRTGDPQRAVFDRFTFPDSTGQSAFERTVTISG